MNQALKGFQRLVNYLNEKLNENAEIIFKVNRYSPSHFLKIQQEWEKGNITFKEANDFLYNS